MIWRRGNYDYNTVELIVEQVERVHLFSGGTWFVGVTANYVKSLNAHRINTDAQGSSRSRHFRSYLLS